MYGPGLPVLGTFHGLRGTATAATPFFSLIRPWGGADGNFVQVWSTANKDRGKGRAHVSKVIYSTGGTAHLISVCRPFNFSTVNGAVAANATSIPLNDDPGVYSTNYKYPTNGTPLVAQVADNPVSTGDYIAFQMADGTWKAAVLTGGSYTGMTIAALPNNGVGIKDGALCYFFGSPGKDESTPGDSDPATGYPQPSTLIAASSTRDASWADNLYGVVNALHEGDPLLFFSPNPSAAGHLEGISGFYSDR